MSSQATFEELRRNAEKRLMLADYAKTGPELRDAAHLLHELRVHEIELQMQNDELRASELDLQQMRDRYRTLYDQAPVGYLSLDAKGRIVEANFTACALLEMQRPALIGKNLAGFMSIADADRFHFHKAEACAEGGRSELETSLTRSDGHVLPVLLQSVAISDGEPGCHTVLIDLSEKRRNEEALRESLERFRQIADRIEDVFYIAEAASGRVLYASPAFERVFGRPLDQLQRFAWLECVTASDQARVGRELERVILGATVDLEYRVVHPDGAIRRVRHRAFPAGAFDRITGIVQDITAERHLQEELRRAQRMEAIGTLTSGIAHDFNNLLTAVSSYTTVALKTIDPAHPACHLLRRSLESTARGTSLTRQLVRFGDRRHHVSEAIEADTVVASVKELLERLLGDRVRLSIGTNAPGVRIHAEPGEIEQVLMNLATNARDAMPSGGELVIRTWAHVLPAGLVEPGRYFLVSVTDNGAGMDAATRAHIFEPFFTTKAPGAGTGLGLSNVFGVMKRLGGHVSVDSEPGHGATFTLYFPAFDPSIEVPATPTGLEAPRGTETVLVVDDEPLVRTAVQIYLGSLGYLPVMATSPEDAVRICRTYSGQLDLLLTDVMMPGPMGRELAHEILTIRPRMKVLFMSAHPAEHLMKVDRLDPSTPLLIKPFDEFALGTKLREVLKAPLFPLAAPAAGPEAGVTAAVTGCRLLVVDDNRDAADLLGEMLELQRHTVAVTYSEPDAIELARRFRPEIILTGVSLEGKTSGWDLARAVRADAQLQHTYLVAVGPFGGTAARLRAVAGGFDTTLNKPIDLGEVMRLLERWRV